MIMTLYEILKNRRSCRAFKPDKPGREVVDRLIEMTLTAPSSKNTRSTRLAVVQDSAVIEKIAGMRSAGSTFVKDAPLAIVVMGDAEMSPMWSTNCAISATILQLAAESLGLGSCWVQVEGRPHNEADPQGQSAEDYLHEIMPATAPCKVLCVVALGYPAKVPHPHKEQDDSDKVIFT